MMPPLKCHHNRQHGRFSSLFAFFWLPFLNSNYLRYLEIWAGAATNIGKESKATSHLALHPVHISGLVVIIWQSGSEAWGCRNYRSVPPASLHVTLASGYSGSGLAHPFTVAKFGFG